MSEIAGKRVPPEQIAEAVRTRETAMADAIPEVEARILADVEVLREILALNQDRVAAVGLIMVAKHGRVLARLDGRTAMCATLSTSIEGPAEVTLAMAADGLRKRVMGEVMPEAANRIMLQLGGK